MSMGSTTTSGAGTPASTTRLKIGPSSTKFHRIRPAANGTTPAPAASGTTATTTTKSDLSLTFTRIDPGADPLLVEVSIPAYDPTKTYTLVSLTAIAIGMGSGKPSDAAGWMSSVHPKATVTQVPTTATTTTTSVPLGTVPAPVAASANATTTTTPVATIPVTPIQQVATTPVATATPSVGQDNASIGTGLPGPAGGVVSLSISNVPNGQFEIQLIEEYSLN